MSGKVEIDPSQDGIDHINVYSKGKTPLGQFLSNFAYSPITTSDGEFNSIEGYWYWLLCDSPDRDLLRRYHGWKAKQLGRDLRAKDWPDSSDEKFKRKICEAIGIKLTTNAAQLAALRATRLPLKHYYVYGDKVIEVRNCGWMLDTIDW